MRTNIATPRMRAKLDAEKASDGMSNLKKKVIDVTSNILSYPARAKAKKEITKNEQLAKDIKLVKEAGPTDLSDKDWKDPLFRATMNVRANNKGRSTSTGYMRR